MYGVDRDKKETAMFINNGDPCEFPEEAFKNSY
jgi:hypothetical protein